MRRIQTYRLLILLTTFVVVGFVAQAQRVAFKTWAASGIVITPALNNGELKFGALVKGNTKIIELNAQNSDLVAAFAVTAPEGYDLTVTIDSPTVLLFGGTSTPTIPFAMKYAYSNQGSQDATTARSLAVEVTSGFSSVTFPVKRNAIGGPPAPPPTPLDGDSSVSAQRIPATAYLFIYGTVGPVGEVPAGSYAGEISITVEYTQ